MEPINHVRLVSYLWNSSRRLGVNNLSGDEGFGYFPVDWPQDDPIQWWNALVIAWDIVDSTKRVAPGRALPSDFNGLQTSDLRVLLHDLPATPDMVLPTGDGFFLVVDLDRLSAHPDFRRVRRSDRAHPFVYRFLGNLEWRCQFPDLDPSTFEGRVGAAVGPVFIYRHSAHCGGQWIAPVGEPFFLAARLQAGASPGGALIHDSVRLPPTPEAHVAGCRRPLRHLCWQPEWVSLKGFDEPQRVWRFARRWPAPLVSALICAGETDSECAILSLASGLGIQHLGWCPQGAHDERFRFVWRLREASTGNPIEVLRMNAQASDGSVVFLGRRECPRRIRALEQAGKPSRVVRILSAGVAQSTARWIRENRIQRLHVSLLPEWASTRSAARLPEFLKQIILLVDEASR